MKSVVVRPREFRFDFSDCTRVRWRQHPGGNDQESPGHSMEYYINDERIAQRFGHTLDPLLADWIDLALDCYLADRLALRRDGQANRQGTHWSRVFNLKVPVRQPEYWLKPDVNGSLSRLLHFFTEDAWRIDFVLRVGPKRTSESQGFLFRLESGLPVRVALYSGGLDSFGGAARQMMELPDYSYVFVSGVTNGRQQAAQRRQVNILGEASGREVRHVTVPYGLRWAGLEVREKEEPSQRTRGFLFLTLGATVAITAGAKDLFVYENGIGAINLPYDGTQIGTSNSRAVHPLGLLGMEEFIRCLSGKGLQIHNPFLFATKGEMCSHKAVHALREHLHLTFSCDGFPVRAKNKAQCGSCTSCLLRRQAIQSAGLSEYDCIGYLNDLLSPGFIGTERQLQALRAMEWQIHRISTALAQVKPWEALVREFVELKRLELEIYRRMDARCEGLQGNLMRLYSQYATEWNAFSARRHCSVRRRIA